MTSRSRKKRRTTVLTPSQAILSNQPSCSVVSTVLRRIVHGGDRRASLVAALLLGSSVSLAQQPIMRPVPRTAEVQRSAAITPSQRPVQANLKWRRSPNVAPVTSVAPVTTVTPPNQVFEEPSLRVAQSLQVAQSQPELRSVRQPMTHAQMHDPSLAPSPDQTITPAAYLGRPERPGSLLDNSMPGASSIAAAPQGQARPSDYFTDPFGDDIQSNQSTQSLSAPRTGTPAQTQPLEQTPAMMPQGGELSMPNDLREKAQSALELPGNQFEPPADLDMGDGLFDPPELQPVEEPPRMKLKTPDDGPQLRDLLRDNTPQESDDLDAESDDSLDALPAPKGEAKKREPRSQSDRSGDSADDTFDNPFKRRSDANKDDISDALDVADRARLNSDDFDEDGDLDKDREELTKSKGLSCTDFRDQIRKRTIDQVSLDISAPYRPDEIDEERYEKLKAKFDEAQAIRQWRNIEGMPLASGRLRDLAYEKAVIETEYGSLETLPINGLSEADLAYINENWGLPQECLLEQVAYVPRSWTPATMTWKASNLCHNPLYFEDVNLERYGHTHGPVLEPIVQTAHFFGNIAVLPYKMGVHGPTECQYSLGYYRPGNCAPWIKPPVPLSLRGAYSQAAVMTGMFWLIP
ncbi:hypothetical protein N9N28_04790 [Rubripirellula amarantea]|nr:hypothetical protein [Rubripirellula amarantea]